MQRFSSCLALGAVTSASWLLPIVVGGIGCVDHIDHAVPHYIQINDDAYLRGEQVTRLDLTGWLGTRHAERAELFLNGVRIAADDFAPFELSWDAGRFPDGAYHLEVLVELDGSDRLSDALSIHIDNTPPTLGEIAGVPVHNRPLLIPADDNFEVARVEVSRVGEPPTTLVSSPFRFMWPWSCGNVTFQVRAVDRAGGETTRSFTVNSAETEGDEDCDHHVSRAAGGDDCNDADATIYGGAPEYFDGVDRNCDGIRQPPPGVDADHDGVASFASGGADCDDAKSSIHGDRLVLARRDLIADGKPLTWNPGEAALVGNGSAWELILNRGGVVESVRPWSSSELLIEPIATGANPASINAIAPGFTFVAFGRGNDVVIMNRAAGEWVEHSVIHADAPVGGVAFIPLYMGVEYAAFQAGTKVYFAASTSSGSSGSSGSFGPWTTQLLADTGGPLVGAPFLSAAPYGANVVFRTATTVWKADRYGTTVPLRVRTFGPPGSAPLTAITAYTNIVSLVAVEQDAGSVLYDDKSAEAVMRFPKRITGLSVSYPYAFVNLDGLGTQVLYTPDHYRRVQMLPDASSFDTASPTGTAFAGSGYVEYATQESIFAPPDISGDGVDTDCNGIDD
jgi:hypothetical protein